MKKITLAAISLLMLIWMELPVSAEPAVETLTVSGLEEPVRILRDPWGVSHIYAANQRDLFFAQGFNAARDRLFQLEIWRRHSTGTLAEIKGRRALQRDVAARLLKLRVDMDRELSFYHPQGKEIITSFVAGINAYVKLTREDPQLLPIEFRLLEIEPGLWTPEIVVSRHNGLYRNVLGELQHARVVHLLGPDEARELFNFHPGEPDLEVPEGLDLSVLSPQVLDLYRAFRARVEFNPEDVADPAWRGEEQAERRDLMPEAESPYVGSNNWVISGDRSLTRHPYMVNDPHRAHQVPSLRYWVHLSAPGWNVVGAGEPALPGVSIGHNGFGAWGLTVFSIDQEDLYVYDTDVEDPLRYRYRDGWESMHVMEETFHIRGEEPEVVELRFTRHGPVLHEDRENRKAYALRAAWLEVGTAPYLASLRMNQARSWEEFRQACLYSRTPSENMVWADRDGNIGWQAAGIAPIRRNWSGLLPVPGDGRYEWEGFLPIEALPSAVNPPQGFLSTANENNLPHGFPYSIGYSWAEPFRAARVREFLEQSGPLTLMDNIRLQLDELSIPARTLVPLLATLSSPSLPVEDARRRLLSWDFVLDRDSIEAGIYVAWERQLKAKVWHLFLPESVREILTSRSTKRMIDWVLAPDSRFGEQPVAGRDALLLQALEAALEELTERLGPDRQGWRYGQEDYKHVYIRHPLSAAVNEELRRRLDVGPLPRGGSGYTVNNTSNNDNQVSGASFRIIVDLERPDNTLGTNTPGQSGDPDDPHYRDLFETWAEGRYFPVLYSKDRVEAAARKVLRLEPAADGR